jgi:predicted Zn-ribbon and HTH transcriptional regulator
LLFGILQIQALTFGQLDMPTIRQKITELLNSAEMDARELSQEVGIKEKEVCEHLIHISRTLDAKGRKIKIRPSECLKCGYVFKDRQRFTRPGRCPKCRQSYLTNPSFKIT